MEHSVKFIANSYAKFSEKRKDKKRFIAIDFINFARENKKKYRLSEDEDDLIATTFWTDDLINDYIKTIQ